MSVISFLQGKGVDGSERTLAEVLRQDNEWLECTHNYIQWLFPLPEESQNVLGAPVLNGDDIDAIRADSDAQVNIKRAAERMLKFLDETDVWLDLVDHNHLRITRILKSLRLLVSIEYAEEFYNQVMEMSHKANDPIQPENILYWTDAVGLSYGK